MANNKTVKDGNDVSFITKTTEDGGGVNVPHVNVDNLPPGAASETTLSAINTKTPALSGGRVPVENQHSQPLTDAQLRASAVPVSLASTPLPTGAATETTLAAINTKTPALDNGFTPSLGKGQNVPFWPGYSAPDTVGYQNIGIDPDGATVTRGSILTDEGTFRCNFANTSTWLSLGAVTVSGNIVTGTGFASKDVHYYDYFKVQGDAESAAVQVSKVLSDTQLELVSNYVGSASGTGERSLLKLFIGAGGSINVASGQANILSGTTSGSLTGVLRFIDFAPLVFRKRFSLSQRIVNQDFIAALEEDAVTVRYFARFRFTGTGNTTVICETGRNPSGAPSASETETTTVTLPNNSNTSQVLEYRIEFLTERVIFYISGFRVAEHTRVIPHQHDEMTARCYWNNTGVPASTSTATFDYITGKNHNKAEIGVMSDSEQIVAKAAPLQTFSFNQAGVIAINTDLIVIDCSQIRSLFIHSISMGTTGVVTAQWDSTPAFTNPLTATLFDQTGASSTTFNAGSIGRQCNIFARYFRLRLTTATTAGTTTINVTGSEQIIQTFLATQPVSSSGNLSSVLVASNNRAANIATSGIWFDDSSTPLASSATFTGTSRDLTVTATATAWANAATYGQELVVSAESEVTGTLWLEVSRDNTNWRRVKSVATSAVTGGGFYAEIVHRPSWRYARVGYTNGAGAQTRFTIGSFLKAI